jgi:tetratricopeptide (TPR) repeat protein
MEAIERRPLRLPRVGAMRLDPAAFAAWLVPSLLILYLALSNGGYGIVERSQVGIAIWWVVLVGTLVGVLPVAGGTRAGRAMLLLLGAFAAWTALSLIWTESQERTSIEIARVATYLGVFALALAMEGEGRWRHVLNGVTTGVVLVCGIAVLSRLEPTWFPENTAIHFFPEANLQSRLAYPLNYSSALGAFAAMALPLLLSCTSSARTVVLQALAAGLLPLVALTLWLTSSGLSLLVAAVALLVFFAVTPDRLPKLATVSLAGAGSAILFAALDQREGLDHGASTAQALHQGSELELIILVVCAGVSLSHVGIGLAVRYGRRPSWLSFSRRQAGVGGTLVLALILAAALGAAVSGELSDRWSEFKDRTASTTGHESRAAQILNLSGTGRYQFWNEAIDAYRSAPVTGIGPGTFEFWWSRNGSYGGFTTDAHSLYLESLAELGIVGFVLVAGFGAGIVGLGVNRTRRAAPDLRVGLAAATAGSAAFLAAAAVDWVWELAVLPVVFLILAAVVIGADRESDRPPRPSQERRRSLGRGILVLASISALVFIAVPLAGVSAVEKSRDEVAQNRLSAALGEARDASDALPYAATPYLQQALILEARGDLDDAVRQAHTATQKEPTNFRTWLTLSRVQAEAGHAAAAVNSYKEARSLDPKSGLFAR